MKELITLVIGVLIYLLASTGVYAETQPVEVVNPITITPPAAPAAPSDVIISGITDCSATVSWSPAVTATGYSVWVDGARWTGSDSSGVEIKGLQPDMTYSVYVTALNDGGESGPSSSATFTTLPPVPTAPGTPTVSDVTGDSAVINWEPLPPWQNIKAYRVYVDGVAVADVEPQTGIQAANLTNLSSGNHLVSISGINDNREGPASAPAQFETQVLPPITGLKMINHSTDTIYLSWDDVTNASQYLISLNEEEAGVTSLPRYALSGLQPNQEYQITVTSVMPDGNQTQAATINAKTLPVVSPYTKDTITQALYAYVPDLMPGIIAVFVVGIAFGLARLSKLAIGYKGFFRYWR